MIRRSRLIIIASVVAVLGLAAFAFGPSLLDYLETARYRNLVADLSSGETLNQISYSPILSEEDFEEIMDESVEDLITDSGIPTEEAYSVLAVSTGELSSTSIFNAHTRELISEATVLKMVTKDRNGSIEILRVVVRMVLAGEDRDVLSFILNYAAGSRGIDLSSADTTALSEGDIRRIFPEGSRWHIIPLTNAESRPIFEGSAFSDYLFHANLVHGGDFSKTKGYLESGLTDKFRDLIFIEELVYDVDSGSAGGDGR